MTDKSKKAEEKKNEALTDAELEGVAGGRLRDRFQSDTGGIDIRGPARTAEGNPRGRRH